MAKTFSYKRSTSKKMTLKGLLNTDEMTIMIDGSEKKLSHLLSDFNGYDNVSIAIAITEDEELDEPEEVVDIEDLV